MPALAPETFSINLCTVAQGASFSAESVETFSSSAGCPEIATYIMEAFLIRLTASGWKPTPPNSLASLSIQGIPYNSLGLGAPHPQDPKMI